MELLKFRAKTKIIFPTARKWNNHIHKLFRLFVFKNSINWKVNENSRSPGAAFQ